MGRGSPYAGIQPGTDDAGVLAKVNAQQGKGEGMSEEEYAQLGRSSSFPVEWGMPIGQRHSDERAAWVRAKVRQHSALTAHRKLANRELRMLNDLRAMELEWKRVSP